MDEEDHVVVEKEKKQAITKKDDKNDEDVEDDAPLEDLRARCLELLSQTTLLENILRIAILVLAPNDSFWRPTIFRQDTSGLLVVPLNDD
jgi:hypothetical protein